MTLFDPERHEPLADVAWDEAAARAYIERIARETEAAFDERTYWRIHPFDVSPERPDALKGPYNGAAGVIWALTQLAREGAAPEPRDYLGAAERLSAADDADHATNAQLAAYVGRDRSAFWGGGFGFRALEWRLAPSRERAARLIEDVRVKQRDVRGLIWGAAGTMIGALHLYEQTGSANWRDAFVTHAEGLWSKLEESEEAGFALWRANLYGDDAARIGALHGFFANAYAILRGLKYLPPSQQARWRDAILAAFERSALVEDGLANWPYTVEGLGAGPQQQRYVQFCVGAPGVVASMAQFPGANADNLLRAGGELIWRAGPLTKMPSLCHGISGSGYALLKLYKRTGDQLWLDRARAFAMHGIGQAERALEQYGQRKFSLWTGDLGLAMFLWSCIRGEAAMPLLDVY